MQCDETNSHDQVVIGGGYSLDTSKVQIIDSVCGIDSKPGNRVYNFLLIPNSINAAYLVTEGIFILTHSAPALITIKKQSLMFIFNTIIIAI